MRNFSLSPPSYLAIIILSVLLYSFMHKDPMEIKHSEGYYNLEIVFKTKDGGIVLPVMPEVTALKVYPDVLWAPYQCAADRENFERRFWNALQNSNAVVICAMFYPEEI